MRHSLHHPIAPGRRLRAWVCLLAILLLWSPLWAAAWQSHDMACCTGGICPLHGHAHPAAPKPQATAPAESPSDCDHHSSNQSGIMNCSLSCCQESSPSLTAGIIFVLPAPTMISYRILATDAPQQISAAGLVPSFEPPSPPPRTTSLSL